ncbi:hypothetical protein J6590_037834 [Homalodisca vitripennis]|nr:hypothetical protein J6590_037834 [Homalodisca vitripennis]
MSVHVDSTKIDLQYILERSEKTRVKLHVSICAAMFVVLWEAEQALDEASRFGAGFRVACIGFWKTVSRKINVQTRPANKGT